MGHSWARALQINPKALLQKYIIWEVDAKAVCLCFSLAHRRSFEVLDRWILELTNYDVPRDQMILIGCKSDLDVEVATD